jgi:hypothetical protein
VKYVKNLSLFFAGSSNFASKNFIISNLSFSAPALKLAALKDDINRAKTVVDLTIFISIFSPFI